MPNVNAGSDNTICDGNSVTLSGSGAISYSWDNGLGAGQSHSVSPSVITTYIVTGTGANGCTNTDDIVVTVNALPNVNAGSDTAICVGNFWHAYLALVLILILGIMVWEQGKVILFRHLL